MDVSVEGDNLDLDDDDAEWLARHLEDPESRFYTCHICGDNWLSIKEMAASGDCQIVFIHQMGMAPVLKRVAHMATSVVLNDSTVDRWEYYVDDDLVDEEPWHDKLRRRRKVLRSVSTN